MPPDSDETGIAEIANLDLEARHHLADLLRFLLLVDAQTLSELAQRRDRDVRADPHGQHETLGLAILRHEGDAMDVVLGAVRVGDVRNLALDLDLAAQVLEDAEQRQQQLFLSLAVQPSQAQDLALAQAETKCR